jgi:hypothetical protein
MTGEENPQLNNQQCMNKAQNRNMGKKKATYNNSSKG